MMHRAPVTSLPDARVRDMKRLGARAERLSRWYNMRMTSLLDDAIEVLRTLPENVQAAAARTLIDCV